MPVVVVRETRRVFRPGVPTDRPVWLQLEDRSVWGRLTEWHWRDRSGWIGRVTFTNRHGTESDWLVGESQIRRR
jgi:hypothetical protein